MKVEYGHLFSFPPKTMPTRNDLLREGRYRIIDQCEADGSGVAFAAYDNFLKTNVALNQVFVRSGRILTATQQEAMRTDVAGRARRLMEINHSSLLKIHDYFAEINQQYLVTELVEGSDLNELVERQKNAYPVAQVIGWADRLLDALSFLHTLKPSMIHREINPRAVKLLPDGSIKLITSGLVRNSEANADSSTASQAFDARAVHYIPLEQIWIGLDNASKTFILKNYDEESERILEQPLDVRSDLYSMAATLYFLLTGAHPADSLERSIDIMEGKPDPLRNPTELKPDIPQAVSDVLLKAMTIRRDQRFDSAVIFQHILNAAFAKSRKQFDDDVRRREEMEFKRAIEEQERLERERQLKEQQAREEEIARQRVQAEREEFRRKQLAAAAEEKRRADAEAQKRSQIEAQQREVAEKQRLIAEKARLEAEVERLRAETEEIQRIHRSETPQMVPVESVEQVVVAEVKVPESRAKEAPVSQVVNEPALFEDFADQEVEAASGRGLVKVFVAGAGLLAVAAIGFGVWSYSSSTGAAVPAPTAAQVSTAEPAKTEAPKPVEPTPQSAAENVPVPQGSVPEADVKELSTQSQTSVKGKPAPTANPASARKAPAATDKTAPAKPKKPVTVEDLLNN